MTAGPFYDKRYQPPHHDSFFSWLVGQGVPKDEVLMILESNEWLPVVNRHSKRFEKAKKKYPDHWTTYIISCRLTGTRPH